MPRKMLSLLSAVAALPAQVPPHAVPLNPNVASLRPLLVAHSGDTVHALGFTSSAGPSVYYARSPDGGRTWPVREFLVAYADELNALAADGDHVAAVVHANYLGPHIIHSADGGVTWSLPVRVSAAPLLYNPYPRTRLFVAATTLVVVWQEQRANGSLWLNRSVDGGATWQPVDTRLDVGIAGTAYSSPMFLTGQGATLNVLWTQLASSTLTIGHQQSLDGGSTWLPAAQVFAGGPVYDAVQSGSTVLVSSAAALQRSADGGSTWAPVVGVGIQAPLLAMAGARALAIGQVQTGSVPWVATVVANGSVDGGATWHPSPATVCVSPPVISLASSVPIAVGDALLAHCTFDGNVSVLQSDDNGATWRTVPGGSAMTALWPSPDRWVATTGDPLCYAFVAAGHTPRGAPKPGADGLSPTLSGVGLPTPGRTFTLAVGNARGGSFGVLGASFAPSAGAPIGLATLWLQQPLVTITFTTSGAAGAAGAGAFALQLAVPNAPSFAGLTLTGQAFVLDAAAADGFTATRAVETWLR